MATKRNSYVEEIGDGQYVEKPLLVTISLEEYRSLIEENSRNEERIAYLENRVVELNKPKGCVDCESNE